jgi:hypothetical protein
MKNILMTALVIIGGLAAGCSQTGDPVEYANACAMENDKKYIEVSGFLDDQRGVFCSNTGGGPVRCGFKLKESPQAEKGFTADIERGTGSSSVEELKSGYKREDIKVRDKDGNLISFADKVKVTGKMNTTPDGSVCYLTVSKIEK